MIFPQIITSYVLSFFSSWKCFPSAVASFCFYLTMCPLPFPPNCGRAEDGQAERERQKGWGGGGYESGECGLCEDDRVLFLLPIHQCRSCWGCWCWPWCRLAAGHLCEAASSRLSCPGRAPPRSYESSSWERSLEWLKDRRENYTQLTSLLLLL